MLLQHCLSRMLDCDGVVGIRGYLEALLYTQLHKGLKGDAKAFQMISNMIIDDPVALDPPPQLVLVFGKEEDGPDIDAPM